MHDATDRIEFETMLLGRYALNPRYAPDSGLLLERSAYLLLSRLSSEGPMSIGELHEAFGLNCSTLNRQTAALLRAGLVERMLDPGGGVARKFRITRKGKHRFDTERAAKVAGLSSVMADWEPADAAAFAQYLERFNRDIEDRLNQPWPRPGSGS